MNVKPSHPGGLGALTRRKAVGLGMAGLLLAASALTVSLAADVPVAEMASHAQLPRLADRPGPTRVPAGLRAAIHRTYGSWSEIRSSADTYGWGGKNIAQGNGTLTGPEDGYSVAISGSTAVVSAPGTSNSVGAAYVWVHLEGGWKQEATIPNPRGASKDQYAWSVAIYSGKTTTYIAIGGNDYNGKPDFVYVYTGSGTTWTQQAKISDPNGVSGDMFGDSLAISSTTLVVGASCENNLSGAAYIYSRSGTHWALQFSSTDPLGNPNDNYGQSVSVSGPTVFVGDLETVYVYVDEPGQGWQTEATITDPGSSNQDDFGFSVALSGTTAVIGAPENASGIGAAWIYTGSGANWSLVQELTFPSGIFGGEYGWSVAIAGQDIVAGAPNTSPCGTAFVYGPSGGKWAEKTQKKDPKCTSGAGFGFAVAASGTTGSFGAPLTNNSQGDAFELPIS